ncbi:unnamed protein product, partial [Polarella glacialis]
VMDAVRGQGVEKVTVIAVAGEEGSRRESAVEKAVDSSSSGAQQWAFFPATSSQQSGHEGSTEAGSTYREDSTEACLEACPEPRYLDDEDEHSEVSLPMPEEMQWSFFAHYNWMGNVQLETTEDSRVATRLQKAKQDRQAERDLQAPSGPLGRLVSWRRSTGQGGA